MQRHLAERNLTEGISHSPVSHPERSSTLAKLAILGQVILLASGWLLPYVSEYDLIRDNISELVLGRYGFIQTIAFVIAGIGTLALAYALWQFTHGSWARRIGAFLVAVYGLGAILAAIFPTDQIDNAADVWTQSTTGMIHITISLVSFPAIIIAMIIFSWSLRRLPEWGSFSIWSAFLTLAVLPLFLGQGEGPWVGLMQRLMVTTISAWLILVALRIQWIANRSLQLAQPENRQGYGRRHRNLDSEVRT